MSLANDKLSTAIRYIGANALVTGGAVANAGFQNVIMADVFTFGSGNSCTRKIFFGEEAPSTNYDAVANNGDEYWQFTFSAGVVSAFVKLHRTGGAWVTVTAA